ncbi:tape measure domain-containing protein [Pseudomonas indoloxydans]|uniref:Tape measure domain-containing protein n=1 Tax=Ectopseudomonas oleovorans TaxID=301 RepID=A0A2T5PGG6_ECTOL|nr:tape measure protein [Pseudomonas indoloxydans]PTU76834.1 tape measure domain-containing protein [Pseudomonas indoloxydans]
MAGLKERLIQFVLRGKDELSPEAKKSEEALNSLKEASEQLGQALDTAKDARSLARGLQQTQRAAEQAERSLVQADLQVKELRDALTAAPGSEGLQQSLKEAEREARRLQRGLDNLRVGLADQEKAAKAAGIDTNNLADEEKRLAAEVDKARQALDANNAQLKAAQREQAATARATAEHASRVDAARESMSRGARQVLAFAAAYVSLNAAMGLVQRGLNAVAGGIRSMLSTGDQFELLGKRMASLMGSVAEGERATAWIKQFAKDTPLEVADVTEAFALLKSYGLDPMDGTLQAVVDKNEQLGGGMERLQGIASALGQAYAKQKLQTEEILQLVERGVPVWGMLEKITGKNAAQLSKLASEGRLGRDVIAALTKEIGASAEGAAAEGMGTLTGLVSNLRDTWTDFLDRIAKSGALEYAKQQLAGVAEYIEQMDRDGRLDKLAQSLSDAFSKGAERVKEFILRLSEVDFTKLIDDSTRWLNGFDEGLGKTLGTFEKFLSGTRQFWNTLTLAGNAADSFWGSFRLGILEAASLLASALPDALGGAKWKAQIDEMAAGVREGIKASLDGVKTDARDLADTFGLLGREAVDAAKDSAKQATAAVKSELEQQRMLDQAHADQLVANQHKVRDEAIAAAVAGTAAITDMGNALNLIDTARTREQLEGLRKALLAAYQTGRLSQEEYSQATGVLNARLRELGTAAGGAADLVSDLDDKLGDLKSVQDAISNARTDVDINNIRAALRKLYGDGAITAAEYNQELKRASDRQRELKGEIEKTGDAGKDAGDKLLRSQEMYNEALEDGIATNEELRRISGQRMEEERKGLTDLKDSSERDMSAMEGFYDGVMNRAREPVAALSRAALEAFDRLRGLTTAAPSIDTSSLDATRTSLESVSKALGDVRAALAMPMQSSLARWMAETQQASLQTQQAFLSQKASLQSLMQSYERGSLTAQQFVRRANSMKHALSLLDESDLSGLESAIEAANQRMQQMGQSTRSTLESLQDELDGLQGRQDDIERRRFAARQRELQAQLAEAQAGGDAQAVANASRALGLLRQIEAESAQARQAEEQKKRMEAQQASQPAAQQAAQTPSKVIRLEIPGRPAVDVAVSGDAAETNLLSILEQAGLRSL